MPPCTGKYALYCIIGSIAFYVLATIPCALSVIIPDINLRKLTVLINLDSKTFATVFHHGDTFYTTVFPLGDFFYFTFMLAAGFVFVNAVTLQCKRSSPFWDHHM